MHVTELWRYPVKSMGGERLQSAAVGELGIEGDRGWGVFDVSTGTVLTARRAPELLFASAGIIDGDLMIALPDGAAVGAANANGPLSAWLGRDVELRQAGDIGGTYEVPLDFENDANWVSWTGPHGAWHDSHQSRVSLVSSATLGSWDIRRFRTNIVVSGSGEDNFVGDQLRVGDAVSGVELAVSKKIDRCVIVTRPQPGLDRDIDLLKQINAERGTCLSIGALITSPGAIAIGDAVTPIPTRTM